MCIFLELLIKYYSYFYQILLSLKKKIIRYSCIDDDMFTNYYKFIVFLLCIDKQTLWELQNTVTNIQVKYYRCITCLQSNFYTYLLNLTSFIYSYTSTSKFIGAEELFSHYVIPPSVLVLLQKYIRCFRGNTFLFLYKYIKYNFVYKW